MATRTGNGNSGASVKGTLQLVPKGQQTAPTGGNGNGKKTSALWTSLYEEALSAERSLRAILPHVFTHSAPDTATRTALRAVSELCEHLMRVRSETESGERALESGLFDGARLLSLGEVATLLGMSTDKVSGMLDEGVLPHLYIGGMLRVPSDRLHSLIEGAVRYGRDGRNGNGNGSA